MDQTSFRLEEAAAETSGEIRARRLIYWSFHGAFWAVAVYVLLTWSHSPLWWRLLIAAIFVVLPVVTFLLAKYLQSPLFTRLRIPVNFDLMPGGFMIRYGDGSTDTCLWMDPSVRLTFFEAAHPGLPPKTWLHVGDMYVTQGIRLNPEGSSAISQAAEQNGLSRSVNGRQARMPTRRLTWTVYTRTT
jgi:hypothetical protein